MHKLILKIKYNNNISKQIKYKCLDMHKLKCHSTQICSQRNLLNLLPVSGKSNSAEKFFTLSASNHIYLRFYQYVFCIHFHCQLKEIYPVWHQNDATFFDVAFFEWPADVFSWYNGPVNFVIHSAASVTSDSFRFLPLDSDGKLEMYIIFAIFVYNIP